jgi:hypothetical protein
MKKFKQFHSEQQYITEVGPFASAMMTAMAVTGLGVAGWKLFKKGKEAIKGYRETKAEKADNKDNGVFVQIKKWDNDKGKLVTQSIEIAAAGTSAANMSNEDIEKKKKELQKKEDPKNTRMQAAYDEKERVSGDEKDAEDEKDKEERGGIEDVKDAEEYFKNNGGAPAGWRNAGKKDKPELMTTKDYNKELERRKKTKKQGLTPDEKKKQAATKDKLLKRMNTDIKTRKIEQLLKFGEFISEGVMSDLLKATKSKKDSEITLDDGTDIPIDPLTSQILVKYIEGLSSSEKNRTIQQIQRTERAFMKVLGKAHENT